MYLYKIITSKGGFEDLEKKVTESMNKGWKPQGGIAFNHGFCYQAMIAKTKNEPDKYKTEKTREIGAETKALSANEAMKKLDQLT